MTGYIGEGYHIDMIYVYVPAIWGTFSWNLVKQLEGAQIKKQNKTKTKTKKKTKQKKHTIGVFEENYCKKHPI